MKRRITALMLILMMIFSAAALASCGNSDGNSDEAPDTDTGNEYEDDYLDSLMELEEGPSDFDQPKYESEEDGAEVVKAEHPAEDFYGMWEATSKRSAYIYGNVDVNIKKDGTWKGNITEEDFHGTWAYENGSVVIKDTEHVIDFTLFYNDDGYLMFCNNEIPEDAFVLEKRESN